MSRTETKPRAVEGISEKDFKILADMVGDEIARKLVDLDVNLRNKVKIDNDDRSVTFPAMEDRHKRTMAHQVITVHGRTFGLGF